MSKISSRLFPFRKSAVTSKSNEDDELHRFKKGTWHTSSNMHEARTFYGAAVVKSDNDRPLIFVAGGLGIPEAGSESLNLLNSIEIFDPNNNKVTLCKHKLKEARYGCGAFTVTKNVMCLLGGKTSDPQREMIFSKKVEFVTDKETKILPDQFSLPYPMAFFGTACITGKVYVIGGKREGGPLSSIYMADIAAFLDEFEGKDAPTTNVWSSVGNVTGLGPRQHFAVVVTDALCWLIGGVTDENVFEGVGQYNSEKATYSNHKHKILYRNGCTGVQIGNNIVVLGGSEPKETGLSKTNSSTYASRSISHNPKSTVVVFSTNTKPSDTTKLENISHPQLCMMKCQSAFKVGPKIYAVGQYDFKEKEPKTEILCMDLTLKVPMLYDSQLDEDAKKIYRVMCGKDDVPVSLSKEFGRACTGKYENTKKVGEGGFGNVFFGFYNSSKIREPIKCVIKRVNDIENKSALKTFENELKILSNIRQPNILMLYGYHLDPNSDDCFLVYEYLDGGSLADFLRDKDRRKSLLYKQRLRIMENVLCALNYFHTGVAGTKILHRDIKPHNICLTKDKIAKLIDFGLARIERSDGIDSSGYSKAKVGTDLYMCKRYASDAIFPYEPACDIYSFGIVMIELITGTLNGKHPDFPNGDFYFCFKDDISLKRKCDTKIEWPNDAQLIRLCKLALQCLSINPDERPSSIELLTEINNMFLENPPGALQKGSADCGTYRACDICNQKLLKSIECENNHILCSDCLSSLVVDTVMYKGLSIVTCSKCEYIFPTGELHSKIDKELHYQLPLYKAIKRLEENVASVHDDVTIVKDSTNLMMSALAKVSVIVRKEQCPHLIWIKPLLTEQQAIQKPSTWLRHVKNIELYFCCEYTGEPVSTPEILQLSKTKPWIRKIAPALMLSIRVLKLAKTVAKLPWPVPNMEATANIIEQAGEFLSCIVDDNSLFANLEKEDPRFFDEMNDSDCDAKRGIYGPAYKELEERYGAEGKFKKELKSVLLGDGSTIWVQKDKAEVAQAKYRARH